MKKLPAVEQARAIMTEGMEWSVWKWLMEKKRVRKAADAATDALYAEEKKVKATWDTDLVDAYNYLADQQDSAGKKKRAGAGKPPAVSADAMAAAKKVLAADNEAYDIRMDAEDIFEKAEQRLSAAGARDGARRALESYDAHEKAIRMAESVSRKEAAARK